MNETSFHSLMLYCWSPERGDISFCKAVHQPLNPEFLHITRITLSQVEKQALALLQVVHLMTAQLSSLSTTLHPQGRVPPNLEYPPKTIKIQL